MPLSTAQKGAVSQFAFFITALVTGKGQIEVYVPAADNEGRDAEVRRHLKRNSAIGIQIKTAFSLMRNGHTPNDYLGIRFRIPRGRVQNDPRFWYFFAVFDPVKLRFHDPVFLIPSDVFHKMGRQRRSADLYRIIANLAPDSHDHWTPYRVALRDLGKRLLDIIDDRSLTQTSQKLLIPGGAVLVSRQADAHAKPRKIRRAA